MSDFLKRFATPSRPNGCPILMAIEILTLGRENAELWAKVEALTALFVEVGRIDHNLKTDPALWEAYREADRVLADPTNEQ